MIRSLAFCLVLGAGAAFGQDTSTSDSISDAIDGVITITPLDEPIGEIITLTPLDEPIGGFIIDPSGNAVDESREAVTEGTGVVLRGLDKVNGAHADIALALGDDGSFGRLKIRLSGCRFPTDNPSGDAFAYLSIFDSVLDKTVFEGWMVASAPALNALDHSRYDIWVLRCTTE